MMPLIEKCENLQTHPPRALLYRSTASFLYRSTEQQDTFVHIPAYSCTLAALASDADVFGILYSFSCHMCTDASLPALIIFVQWHIVPELRWRTHPPCSFWYGCTLLHVVEFSYVCLYRCTLLMLLCCLGWWS